MSDLDGLLKEYANSRSLDPEDQDEKLELLLCQWEDWKRDLKTFSVFPKFPFHQELEYLASKILDGLAFLESQALILDGSAFTLACREGYLKTAQWLVPVLSDLNIQVRYDKQSFILACTNGHLKVAQWLYNQKWYTNESWLLSDSFVGACSKGQLEVVKWLKTVMKEIPLELVFAQACRYGHLEIVEWLYQEYTDKLRKWVENDYNFGDQHNGFNLACRNNHLPIVEWLNQTFPYEVAQNADSGFEYACGDEGFEVAEWLLKTFHIHQPIINYIFGKFCQLEEYRHAEWLMSVTQVEVIYRRGSFQCDSILTRIDNSEVLAWLLEKFPQLREPKVVNQAFGDLCARGSLYRAKILYDQCPRLINFGYKHGYALRGASTSGHIETVQWLTSIYKPGRKAINSAFYNACESRRMAMAKWWLDNYKVYVSPNHRPIADQLKKA